MSRFGQKWFRSSRILISKVLLYICTHDPMTKKVLCFTIEEVPILKAHDALNTPPSVLLLGLAIHSIMRSVTSGHVC